MNADKKVFFFLFITETPFVSGTTRTRRGTTYYARSGVVNAGHEL